MYIKNYEMYHGAVLVHLIRKEKPISLRLIETHPKEQWSTYVINDAISILITHSTNARKVRQGVEGTSWTFSVSAKQLNQIKTAEKPIHVALVCARKNLGEDKQVICLLSPKQVCDVFDLEKENQGITVRKPDGKGKLIVFKEKREIFKEKHKGDVLDIFSFQQWKPGRS
ncbi:MAG: hypothetical protein L6300_00885 [Syntrophaceae bacterium]|nr:hypothetical protein [Syntrophaceae bacterium]